ncbi:hypothetical protein BZA77DRAFT_328871 [Pyronema omphalodes]|nr:hypothetical protein BZA77DRAFT_328871 [Pyronema omphalodes]
MPPSTSTRTQPATPATRSPRPDYGTTTSDEPQPQQQNIPVVIEDDMSFADLCETLKTYFIENIDNGAHSSTTAHKIAVTTLANYLTDKCHNPCTIAALLWCRAEFASYDEEGSTFSLGTDAIGSTRALACEMVACDLTSNLSAQEALQYLCHPLPVLEDNSNSNETPITETTFLLSGTRHGTGSSSDIESNRKKQYEGMNTLEIAVLADAKKFISHRPVQRIITGIWDGSISFWKTLDVEATKNPHFWNQRTADPFCRLRVPKYQKTFEAIFFAALLVFYFAVLVERNPDRITKAEIALIVMFAAFGVDSVNSMRDSGIFFNNVWSWLDMMMISVGVVFLIYRIIGVVEDNEGITDTAFDILSLEALLLVPRIFSLLSLIPFFGVLIPCLKQMSKEFLKFLVLIVILYFGFLTTFSLLARDRMSFANVFWMLVSVFFGSSSVGFQAMREISPILGPPLMLIFVTITNILLITSLISLLSNSLTTMLSNAREEYLFMFSIMVLEASSSSRLVVYYPPLVSAPLLPSLLHFISIQLEIP